MILLVGAVEVVPPALLEQIGEGGRLVAVIDDGRVGKGTVFTRLHGVIGRQVLFDAQIPRLPGWRGAWSSRFDVCAARRPAIRPARGRSRGRSRSSRPRWPPCGGARRPTPCSTCASPGSSRSAALRRRSICRSGRSAGASTSCPATGRWS